MTNPSTVPAVNVEWTRDKLKRLRTAYAEALRTNKSEFEFDGLQLYTPYARYLIEYLMGKFK